MRVTRNQKHWLIKYASWILSQSFNILFDLQALNFTVSFGNNWMSHNNIKILVKMQALRSQLSM